MLNHRHYSNPWHAVNKYSLLLSVSFITNFKAHAPLSSSQTNTAVLYYISVQKVYITT